MHGKVMRFLVDSSLVIGVIVSLLIAWLVGRVSENFGIGVVVFASVLVVVEFALAEQGMRVEQAENIAKIAYNTEQILKLQQGGCSIGAQTSSIDTQPSNVNNANAVISKNWTCQSCGDKNATDSQFCKNCGAKRMSKEERKMYCKQCGKEYKGKITFCAYCGAQQDAEDVLEQPTEKGTKTGVK